VIEISNRVGHTLYVPTSAVELPPFALGMTAMGTPLSKTLSTVLIVPPHYWRPRFSADRGLFYVVHLQKVCDKAACRPYQAGRSKHWIKMKNRKHPAMERAMDSFR
jgi:hypothetical protein